jgi:hypothetical protein
MMPEDDVLDQSDALRRRFRSFVARPVENALHPESALTAQDEEEIPLLTEIIDAQAGTPEQIDALLTRLRAEIETEISAWLVDVLPAAVANASQQILDELDAKARNDLQQRLQALIDARRTSSEAGNPAPSL